MLQTLPGLEGLNDCLFEGKILRQLGRGQMGDGGNDISGFFVLADGGAAVIFPDPKVASRWNQVNIQIAPSLTHINSDNVSFLIVDTYFLFSIQNLSKDFEY